MEIIDLLVILFFIVLLGVFLVAVRGDAFSEHFEQKKNKEKLSDEEYCADVDCEEVTNSVNCNRCFRKCSWTIKKRNYPPQCVWKYLA